MTKVTYAPRYTRKTDDCMGEIRTTIRLENTGDRTLFERGYIEENEIRTVEIEAIADTGARTLALPEEVVERLGVEQQREVAVTYADERRERRPVVGPITITVEGRSAVVEAIVLPAGSTPLIGQVVLEIVDLVADCAEKRLTPSPDSPDRPMLPLR